MDTAIDSHPRERILDAALELFSQHGYAGTSVRQIAARVGLRHAETLHRAFARRVGTTPDRYRQHFARTPT